MQKFFYPASDLDRAKQLLRVLGSFWAMTYEAKDQLNAFTAAVAAGVAQTVDNVTELVDATSRRDIAIWHTENWYPLTLKKSELNLTAANNYKFDVDEFSFSSNPSVRLDAFKQEDFFAFPIPKNFVFTGQLYDRILLPSFSLLANVDFIIERADASIIFVRNPFDIAGVTTTPIYVNGEMVDETITLWAFKAKFDHERLFRQFSYAINARLKSSENSKQLLNAVFDGLLAGGATYSVLAAALSAVFDVPLSKIDGERVELIELDNRGLLIITDHNVYKFAADANPVVAVGDVLRAGDRLINAFEIISLNRGEVPEQLTALALDSGFTSGCFYSDLIFENKEVPLIVDERHPSEFTYVSFPISGFPPDINKFFDEMHARGIESLSIPVPDGCTPPPTRTGTLAHVLDRRKNPVGEPAADDLPATINPLKFIVENVLKNNTTAVIVRVPELGKNRMGMYNIRHIRQLLPPHTTVIFNYIISGQTDWIAPEDTISEFLSVFTAAEPLTDSVTDNLINDRGVTVRVISGSCQ
jgi:hypothetical protein